jgi:acyl carrier protein
MTDRTILSKIIQALADYLKRDAASITEEHHLRDDLGLDSMAVIELLYKIEETFNIQIPDQDLTALRTVGSVAAYVHNRLAPAKASSPAGTTASRKPVAKKALASTSKPKKKSR